MLRFVAFTKRAVRLKPYSAHICSSLATGLRYTWKYRAAFTGEDIGLHARCSLPPTTATGELTWHQFLHQERKLRPMSPSVQILRNIKQGGSKSFCRLDLTFQSYKCKETLGQGGNALVQDVCVAKKLAKVLRGIIALSRPWGCS